MFSAISDPILQAALWGGLIALALTGIMAVTIVVLRLVLVRDQARWAQFVQVWRPLLLALMMDDEVAAADGLPPLLPQDRLRFLRLWVYLHESVRGEAAERLNVAARHLAMDATARRLLHRGSRAARLQAVLALGCLRDAPAWDALARLASARDPLLSINAARALVRIDAIRSADLLMPLVLSREDWDIARVAGFLVEAREAFWSYLTRHLMAMPSGELTRALRLAHALRLDLPVALLRPMLADGRNPVVVRAALPLVNDAALHDEVGHALSHPDAGVREQALHRMAALATPQDVARIAALLDDDEPQVRLASAGALAQLPFLDERMVDGLRRDGQPGRAEVRHALAERQWEQAVA